MFRMLHLFTLMFTGLKLTGYINWSWWLVLSPSILALVIFLSILTLVTWLEVKS